MDKTVVRLLIDIHVGICRIIYRKISRIRICVIVHHNNGKSACNEHNSNTLCVVQVLYSC